MTEAYEDGWLVRVRAQVMCRDEGTGGWLALGGGGLSHVMLGKRPAPATSDSSGEESSRPSAALSQNCEYYIHGVRISDQTEVLSCAIKKDFQYNKVMPTFHHWVSGAGRFGLAFQTAADARAFDRAVRAALLTLLHGFLHGLGGGCIETRPLSDPSRDDEENNIFECLNLPSDSRSSSEKSSASRERPDTQTPILSAITLPGHHSSRETSLKQYGMCEEEKVCVEESEHCPYVHLSAVHEYTYPHMGSGVIHSEKSSPNTKPPLLTRDSGSVKKTVCYPAQEKRPAANRRRCRYCNEWFVIGTGRCRSAPDPCLRCIDSLSCKRCADCLIYHCWSDGEGEAYPHRWVPLGLLSLALPCLCCYAPLRALSRLAASLCPPRHAPAL